MTNLRMIDGDTAKDVAANEVLAEFAKQCEDLTVETSRMTGFLVVAFDEKGNPVSRLHVGPQFSFPTVLVPEIVKQCAWQLVFARE